MKIGTWLRGAVVLSAVTVEKWRLTDVTFFNLTVVRVRVNLRVDFCLSWQEIFARKTQNKEI
jgi:hypothetical protein